MKVSWPLKCPPEAATGGAGRGAGHPPKGRDILREAPVMKYVFIEKHVNGSDTMSFGYARNTYTAVGTNNNSCLDIKNRRLSKLVTEVAPTEVSDVGAVSGAYQAESRFTAFYRLGGGQQFIKDKNGNLTQIYTNGVFLVGGTVGALNSYNNGQMITIPSANIFNPSQGPLANYLIMGDSGSPLFAYDSWEKKWC